MKSTSKRSSLSTGLKLASVFTLLLGAASLPSIRTEAQAVQSPAHHQATVEDNRTGSIFASETDVWQEQPVILPIQPIQIGLSQNGQRAIALTNRSANAGGGCLEVWNTQTKERLLSVPTNDDMQFEATAISDDGSQVAAIVQSQDKSLSLWIWEVTSGQPPMREPLIIAEPLTDKSADSSQPSFARLSTKMAFSPDKTKVVTNIRNLSGSTIANEAQVLQLHSAATGEVLNKLTPTAGTQIEQLTFSPDSEHLAGAGRTQLDNATESAESPVVHLWQTSDGQLVSSFSPDEAIADGSGANNASGYIAAIAFTPDGQLKTLSNQNLTSDRLITWELRAPVAISQVQTLPEVDRQDFIHLLSPDGVYHFMRGDVAGTRLLNTQTLEVTRIDERVSKAAFSADGSYLVIATPNNVQIFSQHN